VKAAAAALLLLGVLRHYGWELLEQETARHAWNISGAVVIVIFLWAIVGRSKPMMAVAAWWTFEELQVIACSLGRILRPWPVNPGEAQCSALLGFDLSSLGLLLVAMILVWQPVKVGRYETKKDQP
jgi:hypothetical protein